MPNIITVKKKVRNIFYYLFPSVEFKISFLLEMVQKCSPLCLDIYIILNIFPIDQLHLQQSLHLCDQIIFKIRLLNCHNKVNVPDYSCALFKKPLTNIFLKIIFKTSYETGKLFGKYYHFCASIMSQNIFIIYDSGFFPYYKSKN